MRVTELMARDALVNYFLDSWLAGSHSGVPTYGENSQRPNMDEISEVVEYDIETNTRELASINYNPDTRTRGKMVFTIGVREGTGSRRALTMRDTISGFMQARNIQGVRTLVPEPRGDFKAAGWSFSILEVPFRFDSTTTP